MKELLALLGISGLSYFSYKYFKQMNNPVRDVEAVPETPKGELDVSSMPEDVVKMLPNVSANEAESIPLSEADKPLTKEQVAIINSGSAIRGYSTQKLYIC